MLEMADMGVMVRSSSTVYVTTPCTNPLTAPPAEVFGGTHWPKPPDPAADGETYSSGAVIWRWQLPIGAGGAASVGHVPGAAVAVVSVSVPAAVLALEEGLHPPTVRRRQRRRQEEGAGDGHGGRGHDRGAEEVALVGAGQDVGVVEPLDAGVEGAGAAGHGPRPDQRRLPCCRVGIAGLGKQGGRTSRWDGEELVWTDALLRV